MLERGRRVSRGGGSLLFTLPWCLGWSPNKAGLRVGCLSLSLGSGMSRDEMEDPNEGKGCLDVETFVWCRLLIVVVGGVGGEDVSRVGS